MTLATITTLEPFNINNSATFTFASTSITANVVAGNIKTDNLLYANGVAWSFGGTYSNTNVAAYLPTYTGLSGAVLTTSSQPNVTQVGTLANLSVTGNISSGGNIIGTHYGNGYNLSSIYGSNVLGQVSNSLIAGTVYTAAQPNITSVGTLASLSVTANVSAGNILTNNLLYANGVAWSFGSGTTYSNSNVAAYLPTYTGNFTAGNANISGLFSAANITTSGTSGNISGANYITANYFTGTLTTAAQPNITSVGTLASLSVTGNVTSAYFIGNGSQLTGLPASYSNTNVAAYLPTYTGNFTAGNISTTGNITAAYFIGNGSQLTGLPASYSNTNVAAYLPTYTGNFTAGNGNITGSLIVGTFNASNITTTGSSGNITGANYVIANYFSGNGSLLSAIAGANVTGTVSSATTAGTVTTNAQPNITSLGTLTSVSITGNVSSGGNIIGNGQYLTSITGANVTGTVGNSTHATVADSANSVTGGNVSGQVGNALVAGTVYTNAQPNITSVGTLQGVTISGNVNVTGNINVTGNLNYSNVNDLVVGDPLIYLGANNTGNIWDLGIVASYNDGTYQHTGIARDHTDGVWKLFTGVVTEPTTVIDWANAIYAGFKAGNITSGNASLGNLASANYFSGNGSLLTSITGGNVTGQVANALVAGTVYSNSQPNITSVGTLTSVNVSGNVSSGGNIIGNGQYLTSITGANVTGDVSGANHANIADVANSVAGGNVTGQVANALVAGTVYSNAQPNITSVGTLTSVSVSGNVSSGGNIIGNGKYLTSITGGNVIGDVSGANHANIADVANSVAGGNVSGQVANALVAGTVYTNAQPNITSVGTLSSLSVTANVSAGNILTDNLLYANGVAWSFGGGGGSNYGNSNVATFLANFGSNTISTTGNVSAGNFIGSGQYLSSITGANVTGTVSSATTAGTVTTNAQPNITSVGTLSSLTVSGLVTATGGGVKTSNIIDSTGTNTISVSSATVGVIGNLSVGTGGVGNLSVSGTTNLGPVGNVFITGGSANYILQTNGSGNLSWVAQSGGGATITDDTSTNATYYPVYATANTGSFSTAGITTTKLQFNPSTGQLTVQDLNTLSDATLKENAQIIDDPFSVLNQIFGMGFTWSDSKRKSYGLLAQMLEGVLPELVSVNAQGKKTVNYIPIIAFLIEAVKKQQQDIEALKKDKY